MEILKEILNKIREIINSNLDNDSKHQQLATLWTKYYKLANKLNIDLVDAYNLYLISENESYIIYQEPIKKEISNLKVKEVLKHYEEIKNSNDSFLSIEEVKCLLDYVVFKTRTSLEGFGLCLKTNSLNGFCEISQALSIMPFEKLGFKVTKNTASDCFNYPFNHCFGTVSFNVLEKGKVLSKTFLLDVTYRQFFSTVRCNEGRYYQKEENTSLLMAPDPGYFIEDENVAKDLMGYGYIELNDYTAKVYGEAFYKASIPLNKIDKLNDNLDFDYVFKILKNSSDYKVNYNELEGIDLSFPQVYNKNI